MEKNSNQLRAYSAANVSTELYTSGQNSSRDALGSAILFSVPIVTNGRVYVGTASGLVAYGELVSVTQVPAAPTNLAASALSATQVQLTWTRNSTNESGFDVERSTDGVNFTQVGLADAGATAFIDSNAVQPDTKYWYRIRAMNQVGTSAYSNVTSTTTLLGIVGLWADSDVGTPGASGGASFANNAYTVSGSGNDIFNSSDNFHYIYQPLDGDGTIIAHVVSQSNTSAGAKAGVMIRATLNGNSAFADVVTTPGDGVLFQDRTTTGAAAATVGSIERSGAGMGHARPNRQRDYRICIGERPKLHTTWLDDDQYGVVRLRRPGSHQQQRRHAEHGHVCQRAGGPAANVRQRPELDLGDRRRIVDCAEGQEPKRQHDHARRRHV